MIGGKPLGPIAQTPRLRVRALPGSPIVAGPERHRLAAGHRPNSVEHVCIIFGAVPVPATPLRVRGPTRGDEFFPGPAGENVQELFHMPRNHKRSC
jgi:hypothetical protein